MKKKGSVSFTLVNALIFIWAVGSFFPLYWMLTSSLKATHLVSKLPPEWFPGRITFSHYQSILSLHSTMRWMMNSLLIAGTATVLIIIVSSLAAYSFSKLRFPLRDTIFLILIMTLMLPKEVYIVPLFKVTQYLGIMGTYQGAILPNSATAFGVFLLKNFSAYPIT